MARDKRYNNPIENYTDRVLGTLSLAVAVVVIVLIIEGVKWVVGKF